MPKIISPGKHILFDLIAQLQERNCLPFRSWGSRLLDKEKKKKKPTIQVRTDPEAGKFLEYSRDDADHKPNIPGNLPLPFKQIYMSNDSETRLGVIMSNGLV